jgi:3-methyladenine DNA glycosylase AlkD
LDFVEVQKLFNSPFHEARLCAAIILNLQFKAAKSSPERKKIFEFYLKQVRAERINNWDIVDVSAPWMGVYLLEVKDPMPLLTKFSKSKSLWQRRVSIILTFALIRAGDLAPTIIISEASTEGRRRFNSQGSGLDAPRVRKERCDVVEKLSCKSFA